MGASPQSQLREALFSCAILALIAIAISQFYAFSLYTLPQGSDICWLIRTGDWIINHRAVPNTDLFCWWSHSHPLVCYQWLFMVSLSILNRLSGLWWIGFISTLTGGLIIFWGLPRIWLSLGVSPLLTWGAICLIFSRYWNLPRPQLFACGLIIVLQMLIDRIRLDPASKALLLIPVLFLFWANFHLTWSFGLLVVLAFVLNRTFSKLGRKERIKYWLCFFASLSAIFINPYGVELIRYGISFTNSDQFLKVYETASAFEAPDLQPFIVYSSAAAVLICLSFKKVEVDQLVLAIFGIWLGLSINRFEPVAIVLSWGVVGQSLAQFKFAQINQTSMNSRFSQGLLSWKGALTAIAISSFVWEARCRSESDAYHQLICGSRQILAMPQERNKGRVYNDPILGSWMIYTETGKPFIDNHFDLYDKQICEDVYACKSAVPGWQKILDKYKFNSLLIPKRCALTTALDLSDATWKKIADDNVITYWERAN